MDLFRPDKPIQEKIEDHFQRYDFSTRIATIIDSTKNSKSIVVGIYGKWGEGKSSVLNFISKELKPETIQINFNPWYFRDESQLLTAFFKSIAEAMGKKITSKKKEILKAISEYSDSIDSVVENLPWYLKTAHALTKKAAAKWSKDTLEMQKQKIEEFIIEANTNFVVFIDDIDRLNIEEVQAVFKLVKLVGDFPRFSYVLAFDNELIAASLGHQFGKGQQKDGYEYLEKIIQVPLQLPQAHRSALRKFSLDLVDKAIQDASATLTDIEVRDFLEKYDMAFVPALRNPRLAIRLANSISFSVPLVYKEVNISDLLIIEAIKIFYPDLYYFIRQNSTLFLTSYNDRNRFGRKSQADEAKEAKEQIDNALKIYEPELAEKIQRMLLDLFPQLNGLYHNHYYSDTAWADWYRELKICSRYYFERYFTYVVKEGDISDVYFTELLIDVAKHSSDFTGNKMRDELKKINPTDFVFKLRLYTPKITPEDAEPLSQALSMVGDVLPRQQGFAFFTIQSDVARTIRELIEKLPIQKRVKKCIDCLEAGQYYEFVVDIYLEFWKESKPPKSFLAPDDLIIVSRSVTEIFKKQLMGKHFTFFPDDVLLSTLYIFERINEFEFPSKLLQDELNTNNQFVLGIIKIFSPTHISTSKTEPFKTPFTDDDYEFMKKFISLEIVYEKTISSYGNLAAKLSTALDYREAVTDNELIASFQKKHVDKERN